jgi:phosphomannomutase
MAEGVNFGTSGVRGLVVELTDAVCGRFTRAFVIHMREQGAFARDAKVLIGRDLRDSSPRIAAACAAAAVAEGIEPLDLGELPTPALALEAMRRHLPAIMITGSHIPADRNGLKFYRASGEIDKVDEAAILAALGGFANAAAPAASVVLTEALSSYLARYGALRGEVDLTGKTIGVYQHSSVARDSLGDVLSRLGATVVPLGRATGFVPVDTEALRPEDVELAKGWSGEKKLDAIVSTDGDADRPLIADETGTFLRGDVVGLLTARFLAADTVVTPVTSTSAVEKSGYFANVIRTRVGSPHVIAGMASAPGSVVVGFEANGGVLLGSDANVGRVTLLALPTRDAFLPIVAVLGLARREGRALSELVETLPPRRTASALIRETPADVSAPFLARLSGEIGFAQSLVEGLGAIASTSAIDGIKLVLDNGDSVHFRASGNAPELRCYTEAPTDKQAQELLSTALDRARSALSRR